MEEKHPKFEHLCYNYVPLYSYITVLQRLQAPTNTASFIPARFERTEFQRCEVIHHMLLWGRGRAHTRIYWVSASQVLVSGKRILLTNLRPFTEKDKRWILNMSWDFITTLDSAIRRNELTNKVNQMSCLTKLAARLAFVGRPFCMDHQPPVCCVEHLGTTARSWIGENLAQMFSLLKA